MKVINGLSHDEVMKAAEEGKKIAWLNTACTPNYWVEWTGSPTLTAMKEAVDSGYIIAVIEK